MDEGLKGTLLEPGYIVDTIDPGQEYVFWRIARIFATLGYAFKYPMGVSPNDMVIDNYTLMQSFPNESLRVICPLIPQRLYVNEAVQKLIPDLKVVDYEQFRDIMKHVMPTKAKYFGPNLVRAIEETKIGTNFHPLYDTKKYTSVDVVDYLSSCKSLADAVEQGLKDRHKFSATLEKLALRL